MNAGAPPLAVVTGASRGIGRACAKELAARGFHVVAVARSQKALESLDDEIRGARGQAPTLAPMDLKDYAAIDRLGAALFERWGRLDALAACAGVLGVLTPVWQSQPSMVEEAFAVNVIANQRLIRSFDPLFRAAPAARAVFVSSGAARNPRAYWGAYAASKAALETYVTVYAQEVAITPIRVNLFDPGPARTAMRAKAFPGEDPMSLPAPEEIAPAIAALLEPGCRRHGELVSFRKEAARSAG